MRYIWPLLILLVLVFDTLHADEASTQELETEEKQPIKQENAAYIKLSDTPQKAAETLVALDEIEEILTEKEKILELNTVLPSYMSGLQEMLDDKLYDHLDTQDIKYLDDLKQKWIVYLNQLKRWQKLIRARLTLYDEHRATLTDLTDLWSETHVYADKEQAPQGIQDHIASVIIKIETLNVATKKSYDMLITDAQLISDRILKIEGKVEALKEAKNNRLADIFVVDAAPLLALIQTTPLEAGDYIDEGLSSLKEYYQNIRLYISDNIKDLYRTFIYMGLIFALMAYLYFLDRHGRLFTQGENRDDTQFAFIKRPLSAALVLSVFASVFVFSQRSEAFKHLQTLIVLIPVILLLSNIVHKKLHKYIYGFFGLYLINFFDHGVVSHGLMDRMMELVLILVLFTLICKLQKAKHTIEGEQMSSLLRHSTKLSYLFCALLVIAFVSNIYGAASLSDRIVSAVFVTITVIFVFYTLMNVLSGTVILLIRKRIANAQHLLQMHTPKLERNVIGMITLIMIIWWLYIMVTIFGVKAALLEWGASILAYSWEFGAMKFSVEGLFNFVVILTITWLIARLVRIFLTLELFTRFEFARGVPTAISTISNHTIFIIGFIVALSTLGITTQEFAMIGGALGVGIGFGIRNIVANFISGIIMLFERPVQIGDTIEVNNTMGNVQTIGTRATSIKTFDGSEVLIPNADFIASDVTNWTLSDERRRAILVIKVDFDSDIEKVLEIMRSVAMEHPNVLEEPEPLAAFEGFGDYYLEFKLYYWLSEAIIPTKSDVAIGIFKSLKAHGVQIPTPTRNIAIHEVKKEAIE